MMVGKLKGTIIRMISKARVKLLKLTKQEWDQEKQLAGITQRIGDDQKGIKGG